MNHNELPNEAYMLRQQATVIAISEAYANYETLEAVADPDRIVRLDIEEITDSIIRIFCPVTILPTCKYAVLPGWKDTEEA